MKWIAALLLATVATCFAEQDGGGRDVTVALFSAMPPHGVTVAAAGPGAWWATCATCNHQPFTSLLRLPGRQTVVAGGPITVRDEDHAQSRTANGLWHFRTGLKGNVEMTLTLPSERYVAAVLMGETLPGDPRESLRAMAVVARTYVLRSSPAVPSSKGLASDTCDSTACQAMRLGPVSDAVEEAVRSTSGETLWYGQQRAQVFFSGSCGGTTESGAALWSKLAGTPYLRSKPDPWCLRKDTAAWHKEISVASLQSVAGCEGWHLPQHIVSAQVTERTSSRRARTVTFLGGNGEQARVSAPALRLAVGRLIGWDLIRSDGYTLRMHEDTLVFDGRGHGHGIGLCQQGATEMARAGKSYREVLAFYFPETAVRITSSDTGWSSATHEGIVLWSTQYTTPELRSQVAEAWSMARRSFSLRQQVVPTVVFAPTTEVFRQMTSQPGWQLASTSGTTIVLQPAAVLAANHVGNAVLLRHEMLHVAVESAASVKTPLWLREGLVELLADDAERGAPALSASETEQLLKSARTRQESQAAHRAAGARVRTLVERYGMAAVRGWLVSGSALPFD